MAAERLEPRCRGKSSRRDQVTSQTDQPAAPFKAPEEDARAQSDRTPPIRQRTAPPPAAAPIIADLSADRPFAGSSKYGSQVSRNQKPYESQSNIQKIAHRFPLRKMRFHGVRTMPCVRSAADCFTNIG